MFTLAGWLGIAFNRPRLVRTYAIIFGLGAILGLIFSRVHDRYLRSRSLRTRGIVFGMILWILLSLSSFGSEFGLSYDTISVIIGLVAYLAYGILLARFLPRFRRNISEIRKDSVGRQTISTGTG
jgi:membrane associated rhomboid family serine protease